MYIVDHKLYEFTDMLASAEPVPGGGGAAAAAAAIGAALGEMVGAITGKDPEKAARLAPAMEKIRQIRTALVGCVDEDARAFLALKKCYGMYREDSDMWDLLEEAYKYAASVPLQIFDLCCDVLELLTEFLREAGEWVAADAGAGAALCRGALTAAALNVRINTKYIRDRSYADKVELHLEMMLDRYLKLADDIYGQVYRGAD